MACSWRNAKATLGFNSGGGCIPLSFGNCSGSTNNNVTGTVLEAVSGANSLSEAVEGIVWNASQTAGIERVLVHQLTPTQFKVVWNLGQERSNTATAVLSVSSNGNFPISVQWERPKHSASGTGQFGTVNSLVAYLVQEVLKR